MLKILQKEMKPWIEYNFPITPSYRPLLGAMEELGELCHAHLKQEQNIRQNESPTESQIEDAIGDIIIYLCHYCILKKLDFETIIKDTWNEVKQRDWKKNPKNGKCIEF